MFERVEAVLIDLDGLLYVEDEPIAPVTDSCSFGCCVRLEGPG